MPIRAAYQMSFVDRSKQRSAADESARISAVLHALGDAVDVFTIDDPHGAPLCFSLFVRDGATWHALYYGADDADPRARSGYFETVFYKPIGQAPPGNTPNLR